MLHELYLYNFLYETTGRFIPREKKNNNNKKKIYISILKTGITVKYMNISLHRKMYSRLKFLQLKNI